VEKRLFVFLQPLANLFNRRQGFIIRLPGCQPQRQVNFFPHTGLHRLRGGLSGAQHHL
jgi:hypothetical protein